MKKIIFFFGAAALICSCSAPKATSYSYSEYKTISPSQSVYTVPLVADLDVAKERITYAERVNQNITKLTDAEVDKMMRDRFAQARKMLDIREKYYDEFRKFLSAKQVQKVFDKGMDNHGRFRKEMNRRSDMNKDGMRRGQQMHSHQAK